MRIIKDVCILPEAKAKIKKSPVLDDLLTRPALHRSGCERGLPLVVAQTMRRMWRMRSGQVWTSVSCLWMRCLKRSGSLFAGSKAKSRASGQRSWTADRHSYLSSTKMSSCSLAASLPLPIRSRHQRTSSGWIPASKNPCMPSQAKRMPKSFLPSARVMTATRMPIPTISRTLLRARRTRPHSWG